MSRISKSLNLVILLALVLSASTLTLTVMAGYFWWKAVARSFHVDCSPPPPKNVSVAGVFAPFGAAAAGADVGCGAVVGCAAAVGCGAAVGAGAGVGVAGLQAANKTVSRMTRWRYLNLGDMVSFSFPWDPRKV